MIFHPRRYFTPYPRHWRVCNFLGRLVFLLSKAGTRRAFALGAKRTILRGKLLANLTRRKENAIMKINTSVALKAGLIGAAAGVVFALLTNLIPFLACVACWVGPAIGLVTGALYVYFLGGAEIGEGAVGGALAGAISGGASGLVSGILSLLGVAASAATSLIGGETGTAAGAAGGGIAGFFIALVSGIVSGAVLGAIGGLIYSFIKKK
jgi:hypothetical protein